MDKIKAKSVIPDEYWILREDNKKVGDVSKEEGEYIVTINGTKQTTFESLESLKDSSMFTFIELPKPVATISRDVEGYPTDGIAYNAVWNVLYKLPLYTQTADSKSWMAAGYYRINIHGTWIVQFCPKLITLQRNEYTGPFKTDPSLVQFNAIFE